MNVGLWGWSTRQERMAYERIVRRYRPDQVLLAVCLNDIPELQNNLARPPALLAALFKGSALVRRVMNAPGREIQNVEQLFTDKDTPRVREAFARFFDEVRALRDEVGKDGATFALAVFPFRFQVAPGAPRPRSKARSRPSAGEKACRFSTCSRPCAPWAKRVRGLRPPEHCGSRAGRGDAGGQRDPRRRSLPRARSWLRASASGPRRSSSSGRHSPTATSGCVPRRPGPSSSGRRSAAPAEAALRRALRDGSPMVRAGAARALGAIGPAANAAAARPLRAPGRRGAGSPLAGGIGAVEARPARARGGGAARRGPRRATTPTCAGSRPGAWATSGPRRARPCRP